MTSDLELWRKNEAANREMGSFESLSDLNDRFVETYPPDLAYVGQVREILARDHAPDTARIEQAVTDAGMPASMRWSARMNAASERGRADTPEGITRRGAPTFGPSGETPTRVSAAATSEAYGRHLAVYPQDAKLIANISKEAAALQPPPSVPRIDPPVR